MAQSFSLNSNNDIFMNSSGNIDLSSGINAIVYNCQNATQAQLGEMIFNQNQGLPNFETVWTGTPDIALWQAYLQQTIQNVVGVTTINSLTINSSKNILSYTANIETIYGNATI